MNSKILDKNHKNWKDWKWQLQNRITGNNIYDNFPNLTEKDMDLLQSYCADYNFAITPYALSLVQTDSIGNPSLNDPIWKQFQFRANAVDDGSADYNGINDNWEISSEMPTPILHQKYPGRAILRIVDQCFGYCNYCYLTKRILDRNIKAQNGNKNEQWQNTLDYLNKSKDIKEILISGGDPLILDNEKLDNILFDLTRLESIKNIRINTRALTFNPFRIDSDFVRLVRNYNVTAIEIHACHHRELTEDFDHALDLFDETGYRPLFLWRTPLLKGINDNIEDLERLFLELYSRRIIPYYLFHYTPFALGRSSLGVSVKRGVKLLKQIRRRIPGPAFPRFTLFHISGKHDIPLEIDGTPEFKYEKDESGNPIIKFKNWKNDWVTYPDVDDD